MNEPQVPPTVEGSSRQDRCLENNKGAEVAANLAVPLPPSEHVLLPGSKVNNPMFIVYDVVDLDFTHGVRLPSRFSLLLQAIYTLFHEETWNAYAEESILDRQCLTVKCQISVNLDLNCYYCFSFVYPHANLHPNRILSCGIQALELIL